MVNNITTIKKGNETTMQSGISEDSVNQFKST